MICVAVDTLRLVKSGNNDYLAVRTHRLCLLNCCILDENACGSNPCQNGATCTDTMGGYTCGPCPLGVTGYNCERSMFIHEI